MDERRWAARVGVPIILASLALTGCQQVSKNLQALTAPRVLKSWDGAFQVTAPVGWNTNRELHKQADLAVAHPLAECYLIVLSESAQDFALMDVSRHSTMTLGILTKNLSAAQAGPAQHLTIAGQPALQYDVTGTANNLRLHYLHTTVKLGGFYHQLLAWTLASRWEREQATLRAVVASFAPTSGTSK